MSRNLQSLCVTPTDISETLPSLAQPSSSRLNRALICVAQEVAERLQRSHQVPVNNNNIRAIASDEQFIAVEPLTERQLEVLQLIADGHDNRAIARQLYVTSSTVKTHVRNILKKLCVSSRTQAAIQGLRSGLVH